MYVVSTTTAKGLAALAAGLYVGSTGRFIRIEEHTQSGKQQAGGIGRLLSACAQARTPVHVTSTCIFDLADLPPEVWEAVAGVNSLMTGTIRRSVLLFVLRKLEKLAICCAGLSTTLPSGKVVQCLNGTSATFAPGWSGDGSAGGKVRAS